MQVTLGTHLVDTFPSSHALFLRLTLVQVRHWLTPQVCGILRRIRRGMITVAISMLESSILRL